MSRMIFCTRLQRQAEGLEAVPYPGELGQRLYREISKAAWQEWQSQQTMLLNEKKLSMLRPDHRQLLEQEMIRFLFEGKNVHIAGYVPLDQ